MKINKLPVLRWSAAAFALASLFTLAASRAAAADLLIPGTTITVEGSKGKFDFLNVDAVHRRLMAAHEKDDTADFFDLETGKLITRLELGGVVDIITDPKSGRYFVSAQDDKTIIALDAKTLKEVGRVTLDGELDALVLVPKYKRVYAAHDNGSHLWAIDTETLKQVGEVAIPGVPELMVYDEASDLIYQNIKTADEVVVISPKTNSIVAKWATAPAASPHGIVLDAKRNRLYVAGGNGKLVALDQKTGKVVASADIAMTVDQAAFDPHHNRIYCAGDKQLSVVEVSDAGLKTLGHIATNGTARNVAVDPKTGNVWTTYTDGKNAYAQSWQLP